ncbi:DNA photolyase, FAD-binding/Cryptochrome [Lineolata rhizophorae]|uniref:Cryptochrome DASH n=1 Tax=Lineolata rhizophorae TaxID=578093 RepID=A0A6A6NPV6_9PEZI|nr:DNA photolyase, FAD-binding/Cryptochrome [Lineolata rhizophorae]
MSARTPRILIYLLRKDLRLSDNNIWHETAKLHAEGTLTHLLPLYVFNAVQVETSGFLAPDTNESPFPEARSKVGGFWRCGPHRTKFLAESLWDVKTGLEQKQSDLLLRVGHSADVVSGILDHVLEGAGEVVGVWMVEEEGTEEKEEEAAVREVAEAKEVEFKLWKDEKYFIDDDDLPLNHDASNLDNVYTNFRKDIERARKYPRQALPAPDTLPPFPSEHSVPAQPGPFVIPTTLESLISALNEPFSEGLGLANQPQMPPETTSAHPFSGGETAGRERLNHLIRSGAMTRYKETRNGLLGTDYSTKLSAFLALGCLTARQVHAALTVFEEGIDDIGADAEGFGGGENEGTAAVRVELLWRDYMRLCVRKFGARLFDLEGFQGKIGGGYGGASASTAEEGAASSSAPKWKRIPPGGMAPGGARNNATRALEAFCVGQTGQGLIDAAARELVLTGYVSNRARQNAASFLAKHLGLDWRLGAEWYECMLVDYDLASNWGNWQYVAGVGTDPRAGRVFNPVKQALDYDGRGEYIRAWVPELRGIQVVMTPAIPAAAVGAAGPSKEDEGAAAAAAAATTVHQERLMWVYQAWRMPEREKRRLGLKGVDWVEKPLVKIQFSVEGPKKPSPKQHYLHRGGRGGGAGPGFRGRGRGSPGGGSGASSSGSWRSAGGSGAGSSAGSWRRGGG